jgi:hypothetical protein
VNRLARSLSHATSLAILISVATVAPAANVVLDYTYASGSFFNAGTSQGLKARATVEAAADYFSTILLNVLPEIRKPDDYISTSVAGPPVGYSWNWDIRFDNPSTGSLASISNPVITADEYRIYVGARNLPGTTLGVGGPGGYQTTSSGSFYTPAQLADIQAISANFQKLVGNRDQGAGNFGRWGGMLTFDTSANWNYDHTVAPLAGQNDLFSIALHELGHAIGFGSSDEFSALRSGTTFLGPESRAANGNAYPTLTLEGGHWADGTTNALFGSSVPQEAAMDPTLTIGTRKLWTKLDAAALVDIGWQVGAPVPEPTSGMLLMLGACYGCYRRA